MASEAGKGSKQRPRQVSNEEYANRWDAIFAKPIDEQAEAALDAMVENAEELGLYDDQGTSQSQV